MSNNTQEEIKLVFDTYLSEVEKFNSKNNASAARRARMALQSMIPLIKQIRKEIQCKKTELKSAN